MSYVNEAPEPNRISPKLRGHIFVNKCPTPVQNAPKHMTQALSGQHHYWTQVACPYLFRHGFLHLSQKIRPSTACTGWGPVGAAKSRKRAKKKNWTYSQNDPHLKFLSPVSATYPNRGITAGWQSTPSGSATFRTLFLLPFKQQQHSLWWLLTIIYATDNIYVLKFFKGPLSTRHFSQNFKHSKLQNIFRNPGRNVLRFLKVKQF